MISDVDEQDFLEPIFARYDEDGLRLIYADFLEESPDPATRARGELIRVQCAFANLAEDDHEGRAALGGRKAELLQKHLAAWTAPLQKLDVTVDFRRGLPDAAALDAGTFLTHGKEIFQRLPLRRLRLREAGRAAEALAGCPNWGRVRELDLCGNELGNGGVNLLLRSPHFTDLEFLDLGFNGLDDAGVKILAAARNLPRLRVLHLNDNDHVTSAGVAALAASPYFPDLHTLDLSGNQIDERGLRKWLNSPHFPRLRALRLASNPLGDSGVEALAASPLLGRMLAHDGRLDLRDTAIGLAGLESLLASPWLDRVTVLDLSSNALGDRGAARLAAESKLRWLKKLSLGRNAVADDGAQALARSSLFPQLAYLDLSDNHITAQGIRALAEAAREDWRAVTNLAGNLYQPPDHARPWGPGGSEGLAPEPPGQPPAVADDPIDPSAELRRRISHPSRYRGPR